LITQTIQIVGSHFTGQPAVRLGDNLWLAARRVNEGLIEAEIPPGLEAGVYPLTIVNGDCQETWAAYTVSEEVCVAPRLRLSNNGPVALGEPAIFTATLLASEPVAGQWNFNGPGQESGADTLIRTFTFSEQGLYTATFTAENACGAQTGQSPITVLGPVPIVQLKIEGPVKIGQPVRVMGSAGCTLPITYQWDFGGPGNGSGLDTALPEFRYDRSGEYRISLRVSSPAGAVVVSGVVKVEAERLYFPFFK
jgi:hypothetical protein